MTTGDPPVDLRLLVPACGAVLAALLATWGRPWVTLGTVAAAALAAVVSARTKAWVWALALAVVVTVGLCAQARVWLRHDSGVATLAADRASARVTGVPLAECRRFPAEGARPAMALLRVRSAEVSARGRTLAHAVPISVVGTGPLAGRACDLPVGSVVALQGRLSALPSTRPEAARLRLGAAPRVVAPPGALDRALNRVRAGLVGAVRSNPADQRALVPSLVVGDTSAVGPRMDEEFRATALTHLMAVSGANLASTTALVWWLGAWLGLRRSALRALSVVGVVAFVLICRQEPSVMRAAAMGLVALTATGVAFDRGAGLRGLCAASGVLMVVDPWLCRSVGFWLSVCATAGILWWTTGWVRTMDWAPEPLARMVAVPWAAQLATQPVVTSLSSEVSTTGVVANLLAAPFVAPATILGMAAALLSWPWPAAAHLAGWLAGWSVQPILWIAHWGAGLPGARIEWPTGPVALGLLAVTCGLLVMVTPTVLARRRRVLVALATILVAGLVRWPMPGWPGHWAVAVCDVGQGSATVARAGPHAGVVVDTGPDPTRLRACLDGLGVREVPLLVLSHHHGDHVGGLEAALEPGTLVLTSALDSPPRAVAELAARVRSAGARTRHAEPGEVLAVGGARVEVLASLTGTGVGTGGQDDRESPVENDSSVQVRLVVAGLSVLVTGDIEAEGQRQVRAGGTDLGADVLVVPHHGSARQDEGFWRATTARVAVVSVGAHNPYRHPSPATLRLASSTGMRLWRTDEVGTVALAREGPRIVVRTSGRTGGR